MSSHHGDADPPVIEKETVQSVLDSTGGDPAFFAELLEEFQADAHTQLAALRTAAATDDSAGMTRAAHTLKSTAATFGVQALSERCRILEADARAGALDGAAAAIAAIDRDLDEVLAALSRWDAGGEGGP